MKAEALREPVAPFFLATWILRISQPRPFQCWRRVDTNVTTRPARAQHCDLDVFEDLARCDEPDMANITIVDVVTD
jgi:hypothetical protein